MSRVAIAHVYFFSTLRGRERVMTTTFDRLKRRRDSPNIDVFTFIEIIVVIVVLGILAAIVIFALGGFEGKVARRCLPGRRLHGGDRHR